MNSSDSPSAAFADPDSQASFDQLPLPPETLANLEALGYRRMTEIQAASLPIALSGHDLIAQAKTGSGKTAAFGIALLDRLNPRHFGVQALVLCPTRELADQVTQEIRRLARAAENIKVLTLCGGVPIRAQTASLMHGAHVVVGTPGRLIDHLVRESLVLDGLKTLVLDEADRMLDMGFLEDLTAIVERCPAGRQTLMFSATFPDDIVRLGRKFMRQPREVKVEARHAPAQIRQRWYEVTDTQRLHAVSQLLRHFRPRRTLAFCNTKQQCRDLVDVLTAQGFHALALHGDLEQRERDQVLIRFANYSCSVLVATDVAARGLDIDQLEAVIDVDVTPDPELHVHRIGRTGRAGAVGQVFNLASREEMGRVAQIDKLQGRESEWHPLDELQHDGAPVEPPPKVTLQILGGRKEKIRAGDVLGALTKDHGFAGEQIGKIDVTEFSTYVAVDRAVAGAALSRLDAGRIKGKLVKARRLD